MADTFKVDLDGVVIECGIFCSAGESFKNDESLEDLDVSDVGVLKLAIEVRRKLFFRFSSVI